MAYRRCAYTYDSVGRVLSCSIYTSATAQTPAYVYAYTYNSNSRLSTFTVTTPTKVDTISYTYDNDGNIVSVVKTTQEVNNNAE